jgi:hypothetical protein
VSLVAPAERLRFDECSFDGILLNAVLEHIEDKDAALGFQSGWRTDSLSRAITDLAS